MAQTLTPPDIHVIDTLVNNKIHGFLLMNDEENKNVTAYVKKELQKFSDQLNAFDERLKKLEGK